MNQLRRLLSILFGLLIIYNPGLVYALSSEQKKVIDSGIRYFNTSSSTSCGTSNIDTSQMPAAVPEPHKTLFSQAAASAKTSPQYIAVLFLSENANQWRPFDYLWDTAAQSSPAAGPFQFMPGTWEGYKTDGNNDGVADINNIVDAAYSAANWLGQSDLSGGLGNIDQPFAANNTFLYFAASYNWGPARTSKIFHTDPSASLSVAPLETQNYVKNSYALITSGFTKGDPSYGDPQVPAGVGASAPLPSGNFSCASGVVANNIAQTAINLSWPEDHGLIPKPEYVEALNQYNPDGKFSYDGADCGVFVATVMHATGADPDYPASGTSRQAKHVIDHPEKYDVVPIVSSTADLLPGDILIVTSNGTSSGHTYIFVGNQPPNGYNQASASLGERMPNLGRAEVADYRGNYMRARLK